MGWGWGAKSTMGVNKFNLRRSQIRKFGKIHFNQVFPFSLYFHHKNKPSKNIFLSYFPLFISVAKNIFRQRNIGGAFALLAPPHPKSRLPILRTFLQTLNSDFFSVAAMFNSGFTQFLSVKTAARNWISYSPRTFLRIMSPHCGSENNFHLGQVGLLPSPVV